MSTLSRFATYALTSALAVAALAPARTAAADAPWVLRPGTRPFQLLLGAGPAWGPRCERPPGLLGECDVLKVSQEFAAHFRGDASGPALGLLLGEEVARNSFEILVAPKFSVDIQPRRDLGLYLSPSISLGYRLMQHMWSSGQSRYHTANVQLGLALKLVLADRWLVWLQFPQTDLILGRSQNTSCGNGDSSSPCRPLFLARLNLLVGVGVSF